MNAIPLPRSDALAAWRLPLLGCALLLAVIGALFHETLGAMFAIWMRSDTFAHCFLVPPISAWLVWRGRARLVGLVPAPSVWAWPPFVGACVLWLLGELAGVNAASQTAVMAMLVLSVPALLGLQVARALAFPLLFLFFAVPAGEFLTEPMIDATADFTVSALQFTGVPVYREGRSFVIPSGSWSVIEACSGVRYLIASFMVGTLFAYLNFATWRRRAVFMLVSLAVPVLANWVRAYMIVMLGHLSGNKLAVGVDHLIYGWVFFGIVIMAMFMLGARFADGGAPAASAAAPSPATAPAPAWRAALQLLTLVLLLGATHQWAEVPAAGPGRAVALALPDSLPGGWQAEADDARGWLPAYVGANATAGRRYRRGDQVVSVWLAYYRDQTRERKLVTSTNQLVLSQSPDWLLLSQAVAPSGLPDVGPQVRTAELRTPADPHLSVRARVSVRYAFWVQGRLVTRDVEAKLRLALGRLLGQPDDSAGVFFHAEVPTGSASSPVLAEFVSAQWPSISEVLRQAAALPAGGAAGAHKTNPG